MPYTFALSKTIAVLIYPYWNVNNQGENHITDSDSFNLPILECKFGVILRFTLKNRGFNLPILECKLHAQHQFALNDIVLIYPYWNVNLQKKRQSYSLNRF